MVQIPPTNLHCVYCFLRFPFLTHRRGICCPRLWKPICLKVWCVPRCLAPHHSCEKWLSYHNLPEPVFPFVTVISHQHSFYFVSKPACLAPATMLQSLVQWNWDQIFLKSDVYCECQLNLLTCISMILWTLLLLHEWAGKLAYILT